MVKPRDHPSLDGNAVGVDAFDQPEILIHPVKPLIDLRHALLENGFKADESFRVWHPSLPFWIAGKLVAIVELLCTQRGINLTYRYKFRPVGFIPTI
jgi:hypothetical protein